MSTNNIGQAMANPRIEFGAVVGPRFRLRSEFPERQAPHLRIPRDRELPGDDGAEGVADYLSAPAGEERAGERVGIVSGGGERAEVISARKEGRGKVCFHGADADHGGQQFDE